MIPNDILGNPVAVFDITGRVDGTPVSNLSSIQNVFGIFTNDGNLNLAPNSTYVAGPGLGLEINSAVVTFNSNTLNDAGSIEGLDQIQRQHLSRL